MLIYFISVTGGATGGSSPEHWSPRSEAGLEICEKDCTNAAAEGYARGGTGWAGARQEPGRKPGGRRRKCSIKGPSLTARSPL